MKRIYSVSTLAALALAASLSACDSADKTVTNETTIVDNAATGATTTSTSTTTNEN